MRSIQIRQKNDDARCLEFNRFALGVVSDIHRGVPATRGQKDAIPEISAGGTSHQSQSLRCISVHPDKPSLKLRLGEHGGRLQTSSKEAQCSSFNRLNIAYLRLNILEADCSAREGYVRHHQRV